MKIPRLLHGLMDWTFHIVCGPRIRTLFPSIVHVTCSLQSIRELKSVDPNPGPSTTGHSKKKPRTRKSGHPSQFPSRTRSTAPQAPRLTSIRTSPSLFRVGSSSRPPTLRRKALGRRETTTTGPRLTTSRSRKVCFGLQPRPSSFTLILIIRRGIIPGVIIPTERCRSSLLCRFSYYSDTFICCSLGNLVCYAKV